MASLIPKASKPWRQVNNEALTGGKNKRTQTTYRRRCDGQSACCGGSCRQYSRHQGGHSLGATGLRQVSHAKGFCADAGYRGTFVRELGERFALAVDISEKIKPHEWEKLPRRWVMERTFGWLNHSPWLSKDYEISTSSAATMVTLSHLHTLLKRM